MKHPCEVGSGDFDVATTTFERQASTTALKGWTEDEPFFGGTHHGSAAD